MLTHEEASRAGGCDVRREVTRGAGNARLLISLAFAAAIPVLLFSGWVAYVTADKGRAAARPAS